MTDESPRVRAFACFDAMNRQDPRRTIVDGVEWPEELLYAERMTAWLERLAPEASDELRLAARAQHIRRWEIPRTSYPAGRDGYKQWRADLARFHARLASEVLRSVGYGDDVVGRVEDLIEKKRLKTDAETQQLEDVICLVFLESYLAQFAATHADEALLVRILERTWLKMSARGQAAALALPLHPDVRALVEKALGTVGEPV